MANRTYLYSLSHRPTAYEDRPVSISGLSEWAYDVPFVYRLLMSGDPQRCASLISEGLDSDTEGQSTPIHAISASFDPGFERVQRFAAIVKSMIAMGLATAPQRRVEPVAAPASATLFERLKRVFAGAPQLPVAPPAEVAVGTEHISRWLDDTISFLQAHRDTFLLLETIEVDLMTTSEEGALRSMVEQEIARCVRAGAALDALPADPAQAARALRAASDDSGPDALDAFRGLRFDDSCEGSRKTAVKYPMGLSNWSDVLYFDLFNRAEFDAHRARNEAQP